MSTGMTTAREEMRNKGFDTKDADAWEKKSLQMDIPETEFPETRFPDLGMIRSFSYLYPGSINSP